MIADDNNPKSIKESMQMLYTAARRQVSQNATVWGITNGMSKIWFDEFMVEEQHQALAAVLKPKFASDIFEFFVEMEGESND